jgi:hypothetical protein
VPTGCNINLRSNEEVLGDGIGKTIINYVGPVTTRKQIAIFASDGYQEQIFNLTLSDMSVECNGGPWITGEVAVAQLYGWHDIHIRNMEALDPSSNQNAIGSGNEIEIFCFLINDSAMTADAWNTTIENCSVINPHGTYLDAFTIGGPGLDTTAATAGSGYYNYGARIEGCSCFAGPTATSGCQIGLTFWNLKNFSIKHNYFYGHYAAINCDTGVDSGDISFNYLKGNLSSVTIGSTNAGWTFDHINIHDNTMVVGSTAPLFKINGNCSYFNIHGNNMIAPNGSNATPIYFINPSTHPSRAIDFWDNTETNCADISVTSDPDAPYPGISSGFSATGSNIQVYPGLGQRYFQVVVGTTSPATSGTIQFASQAPHAWILSCQDVLYPNLNPIICTNSTPTSATIAPSSGAAFHGGDLIRCTAVHF